MTTIADAPAPSAPPVRRSVAPSELVRTLRFTGHSIRVTFRDVAFVVFTVALPVGMYLLFSMLYGDEGGGAGRVQIMANMAAYGGLGAAITAGTQITESQRNGFLRQLLVAGLTTRAFLVGGVLTAGAVVLPALVVVVLVGALTGAGTTPAAAALGIASQWIALVPMLLIGILLGTTLRGGAATAAGVVTMMGLAIVGGLWIPLDLFPAAMQDVGHLTPGYVLSALGAWAYLDRELPVGALLVTVVWSLVVAGLCVLARRRTGRMTRR